MKLITPYIGILFLLLFLTSCNSKSNQNNYEKLTDSVNEHQYVDGYVGDQNCVSCHEKENGLWKGSHHDLAMEIANDSTVLGDFNDVKTEIDGVKYHFYKKENDFLVKVNEIDSTENIYQITYTFGVTPLQQYLIDFERGKKQVLRVTWDSKDHKWFHQYAGDKISTHDWLHWTKSAQNWNTMCAECHSTNLKKNYFVEKDSFHTTYSYINVSCEMCHGPGEKHVNWANSDPKDKNYQIILGKTQHEQVNLCAPCHSRRSKLTANLEPGKHFEDQYMIQTVNTNYYHADGQIDDEDYVFGSFMQSMMYANKVKCSDCHDMHSMQLKFDGNTLCAQCHVNTTYDTKKHHFHKENTEASQCINCHMTGKNYMGNDFRRDHSFRVPRPDQSVKYNTPNACKGCHKDESNQWAANWIKKWYGPTRRDHYSDGLILSSQQDLSENQRKDLDDFINNLKYPAITRATAISNLNYSTNEQYKSLLTALADSSALVRYNALLKFRYLPMQDRMPIVLKHLTDTTKMVRIGAARIAIGFDENSLNDVDKTNLINARREYENMMYGNADFSTGRMQLGDYFLQNNDVATSIKHYEIALEKDSLLIPVYSNLATAYSINGEGNKALQTLILWINLEPNNGRPYYLRALLYFELKQDDKAVTDLKKAIELNPNETRSMYNLATYYFQDKKDLKLAEKYIQKGLKIDPNNTDYKYLLALIYRDQS
ncbi:MAG: tetratricopeptide repeat protein, partial [Flavobacteriaceae bacterium]|nr:tetratricopeptide repeat protein [Flavobacteriaceae bacterium]